jgi:hypothetical protein
MVFHGTVLPQIDRCDFDSVLYPIVADTTPIGINIQNCNLSNDRWLANPTWWAGSYGLICINGGNQHRIINNYGRSGNHGIVIVATDCLIEGNNFPSIGLVGSGLHRGLLGVLTSSKINDNYFASWAAGTQGIYIEGSDNTINGNTIRGFTYSALELAAGSAHNVIIGNNGKTTAGLSDGSGHSNIIEHNYWN